jgi:arabinofuranosyltransferase
MTQVGQKAIQVLRATFSWSRRQVWALISAFIVLLVVLPNAWLGDDIFISLRTAKNFVAGHGLVWNLDDRVQAFTHPLWEVFLIIIQWLFPSNVPLAVIWLGIITTLVAVVLFFRDVKSRWLTLLAVVVLVSSKAFIDYSTSGLENPALYVLIILFADEYLGKQRTFWLTLIAALAAITRLDALALILPAIAPLVWKHWRQRAFWNEVGKGAIPLVVWELFSLVYFGYFLPNTVYAKTLTYIPQPLMYQHGLNFFANSLDWDKITIPAILLSLVLIDLTRKSRELWLAAGIVLYLLVVFHSGGDYMSGRFLAVPFFLSLYLAIRWLEQPPKMPRFVLPALSAALLLFALVTPYSPVFHPLITQTGHTHDLDFNHGNGEIANEGAVYCAETCLFNLSKIKYSFTYRELNQIQPRQKIGEFGSIGMVGYYGSPQLHIVDDLALADPLLSHLSADTYSRIGHFHRLVAPTYIASIQHHKNLIDEPCTRRLYGDILPVVTGPLFSFERFGKIIKLNSGFSDLKYKHCVQRGSLPPKHKPK